MKTINTILFHAVFVLQKNQQTTYTGGLTMIVTLTNHSLTAQIDSIGAQLISLKDTAADTEYIWQRDPAYWKAALRSCFQLLGTAVTVNTH